MKKKHSISNFAVLLVFMMSLQVVFSQTPKPKETTATLQETFKIHMTVDYQQWENAVRYEAVSFEDDDEDAERNRDQDRSLRRGNNFNSPVRRNQVLQWTADLTNAPKDVKIILISVVSNPKNPGVQLLDRSYYDAQDDGKIIRGKTQGAFPKGAKEHYIISFAITNGEWYSIFTIDPIITGHL